MDTLFDPFTMKSEDPVAFPRLLAAGGRLRPAFYDPRKDYWVILRHAHVSAALRNPEVYSSGFYDNSPVSSMFVSKDGAEHLRGRRMFTRAFAPLAVRHAEENVVRPAAEAVIGRMLGRRRLDLVRDFCLPLPQKVIGDLMGVGEEFVHEFVELVPAMIRWTIWFNNEEAVREGRAAQALVMERLRPVVAREVRSPRTNLLSGLIQSMQEDGTYNEELTLQIAVGLLLGGYETTSSMLAGALTALLFPPEAMEQVRQRRELLMPAVEESTRWFASAIGSPRRLTRDVTLDEVTLPAGASVLLCSASAHYDEEVFPRPEVFDLHRKPGELMLFGGGPHHCLGAPLARMEARVGLGMLLDRLPRLRLDPDSPPVFGCGARGVVAHGPEALHVVPEDAALPLAA